MATLAMASMASRITSATLCVSSKFRSERWPPRSGLTMTYGGQEQGQCPRRHGFLGPAQTEVALYQLTGANQQEVKRHGDVFGIFLNEEVRAVALQTSAMVTFAKATADASSGCSRRQTGLSCWGALPPHQHGTRTAMALLACRAPRAGVGCFRARLPACPWALSPSCRLATCRFKTWRNAAPQASLTRHEPAARHALWPSSAFRADPHSAYVPCRSD